MRLVACVTGTLIATLLLGAVLALSLMPGTEGVRIDTPDSGGLRAAQGGPEGDDRLLPEQGSVAVEPAVVVDVEGAVERPGVVHVPAGGRVGDALRLAGGFAAHADLEAAADTLNLAQLVSDGLKVVVPAIGDAPAVAGPATALVKAGQQGAGGLVDLNQAPESVLDGLPGVGPATIAKIIAARTDAPFRSVDELRSRDIVGEAAFAKLRDLVTVRG